MKIAIAGYGIEGKENYLYWKNLGFDPVIVDENENISQEVPADANSIIGKDAFSKLNGFDLVVRTAGLPPRFIKTDGKIWSATNEFFAKCPAKIIGITGTKGKGTTSSFIASILRAAGKKVHLVGNIGIPALSVLGDIKPDDIVVYEMSSFQLWDLEKSPNIAVVLMIEPDHLDKHLDMEDYVLAKGNIAKNQTAEDFVVYNSKNEYSSMIKDLSPAHKINYISKEDSLVFVENGEFVFGQKENNSSFSISAVKLPGSHNIDNALAAMNAVMALFPDMEIESVKRGLSDFTGLPHRLKYVKTVGEVDFYDDSIATTPGSAIAAINAFSDRDKVIILGGSNKGVKYDEVISVVKNTKTKVVSMGETGKEIHQICQNQGIESVYCDGDMNSVVKTAFEMSEKGGVVLLSPASASFDMFKSYSDRGDKFISAVEGLNG